MLLYMIRCLCVPDPTFAVATACTFWGFHGFSGLSDWMAILEYEGFWGFGGAMIPTHWLFSCLIVLVLDVFPLFWDRSARQGYILDFFRHVYQQK